MNPKNDTATLFLDHSRKKLFGEWWPRLQITLEPLSEEQLWWRPNQASNSIGNLLLHLNGNVRQWLVASFNRLDDLAAIVGLVPGIYESSDNKICLGLSKRSNRYIRSLLVEATWVAVRADMALQTYYRKHSAKEPNKAIIKVAHKLLSRMRAVIITGVPYQTGLMK